MTGSAEVDDVGAVQSLLDGRDRLHWYAQPGRHRRCELLAVGLRWAEDLDALQRGHTALEGRYLRRRLPAGTDQAHDLGAFGVQMLGCNAGDGADAHRVEHAVIHEGADGSSLTVEEHVGAGVRRVAE